MGIFDGIMILSDLDGTLVNNAVMSENHLKSVQYFVDNGGNFCLATGREEKYLFENYPPLLTKDYCIVKNGTAIYDCRQKKYIWYQPLATQVIDRVIFLLNLFPQVKKVTVHTLSQFKEFKTDAPDFKKQIKSINEEILKVVLLTDATVCGRMHQHCCEFDDFQYVRSCPRLLEILSHGADKGICLEKLRSLLPQITHFVGIGDFQNDIGLLQAADIGVAVESEFTALQKYADWVAPPIEQHPISWLIDKLKAERLTGNL